MPPNKAPVVVHQHTALMVCKTAAIMEELLVSLDLESHDIQRLGARALVAPSDQIEMIQRALNQQGIFPKIVGEMPIQGES